MVMVGDNDVFVSLSVFVGIFNYVYVDNYGVVGGEVGNVFGEMCDFFLFELLD